MALFRDLTPRPADALLGLMAEFRADPRTDKVDLGVGVFRDDTGHTPIMNAVRMAEAHLAERADTKAYEGPMGNRSFADHIEKMVFGGMPQTGGRLALATPGGCGALFLAAGLIGRLNPQATVWMSNPTWANHKHIMASAGLKTDSYRYADVSDPGVDIEGLLDSLNAARPGDAIVVQGPCHNPTGIDLDTEQWNALARLVVEKQLLPLIDIAYHGFGRGLEEDIEGVRVFLANVPDVILSYSCSKNFGLYRDRAGCFLLQSEEAKSADVAGTHVADISRAGYSMPPAHGPAVVATIFDDPALYTNWHNELTSMRERMQVLRAEMAETLSPRSNSYDPSVLVNQKGMFSQLPISKAGIDALKEKGFYIPGSGRINIAGLKSEDIPRTAAALSEYL